MSCNSCGVTHGGQCGEARLKISINDCNLCYSLDGVPGLSIPLSQWSCCIAQPVLRLNVEKKQLEMDDNCYTATSGTRGQRYVIPTADIGKLISLQDLSNFCDNALEKCGIAQVCLIDGKYQLCARKPKYFEPGEKFELFAFHKKDGTECEECGEEDCTCYKLLPYPEDCTEPGAVPVLTANGWSCPDPCMDGRADAIGYKPVGYSGVWTSSGEAPVYSPVIGTPSYTNDGACCRLVRIDVHDIVCAIPQDLGSYNVVAGLELKSDKADIGGKFTITNYGHFTGSGLGGGTYQRLTAPVWLSMTVKLQPGETVNWTVRSYRRSYDGKTYDNDDGTRVGGIDPDPQSDTWAITSWRTEC